nr:hypothetical protein [uncultured Novosphingobium sp.]
MFSMVLAAYGLAAGYCPVLQVNGAYFDGAFTPGENLPTLQVSNGTSSYAFVRLQNVTQPSSVTMYLSRGGTAVIENIPPGTYELRFAYGGKMLADCTTVVEAAGVSQFDNPLDFAVNRTETPVPCQTK